MKESTCSKAEIVEVIKVIVHSGSGEKNSDPIKEKVEYWTKDGEFLFSEY
ncbi:hypothetical protein [Salibacterium aidingense]|nr:hypothetical protein [Salibacterium aidingense]